MNEIERYRIPIVHDSEAFELLTLVSLLGPIDNESLKNNLRNKKSFSNNKLIELYKSGIIVQNSYRKWCLSNLGNLVLSKLGVNQIVSASIIEQTSNFTEPDWLTYLVRNDNNVVSSSSFYTRVKIADWFYKKIDLDEEVFAKRHVITCLFFTEKNGFYRYDSDKFYDTYLKLDSKSIIDKNKFSFEFDSCRNISDNSNSLLDIPSTRFDDISRASFMLTAIRILSSALTESQDSGVVYSYKKIERVIQVLDSISTWSGNISEFFSRYLLENTNKRISKNSQSEVLKFFKDELLPTQKDTDAEKSRLIKKEK